MSIKTQSASATTQRALIDTGTTITTINKSFLDSNNIKLKCTNERILVHSIYGSNQQMKYEADFEIDDKIIRRKVLVIDQLEHDILLGMDIIMYSNFYIHYNAVMTA